jgi:uncharacterized lipoprotein YddW (UPF0748 family)
MRFSPRRFALVFASATLAACGGGRVTGPVPTPADTMPPPITREMRGLWIATVRNIDWPSRPGLTAEEQRAELTYILDRAAAAGFNAVMFQVRPAADALYRSSLEPWGAMLTGLQGVDPGYDPLDVAIEEAHARGLELHAWINPFRVGVSADTALLAPTHSFWARRDVVHVYGSQLWFDPGEPEVHDHTMSVVRDIVQRYDIDAVHMDDYFYPYPESDSAGTRIEFPDSASYERSGSALSRDDWRRDNVDRFVERLYREVHELAPAVKVGVSPFGIWRPGHPPGVNGFDAYAAIYADAKKWLQEGWVDYFAPQLYWAIDAPQQSFPALLDWWLAENTMSRYVWPGLATYRVNNGSPTSFDIDEIPEQIGIVRERPSGTGYIMFNTTTSLRDDVATAIAPLQQAHAIAPAFTWLDGTPPPAPTLTVTDGTVAISPAIGEQARWWLLRVRIGRTWSSRLVRADRLELTFDGDLERVLLNAIDKAGNASPDIAWPGIAVNDGGS